jgi:hypothetical protein
VLSGDERFAVLGAEDEVDKDAREGLGHGDSLMGGGRLLAVFQTAGLFYPATQGDGFAFALG